MKLTLRYLLAYLDDILPSADARQVGQHLQSNKTAHDIVERIRDVVKQRRLSASDPLEKSAGNNANEVAEFLDNLLTPEEMRTLEEHCLRTDESLAEVAAAHQILSLILTGGGSIAPDSTRQKLKQMAQSLTAPPAAATAGGNHRHAPVARDIELTEDDSQTRMMASPTTGIDTLPPLNLRRNRMDWRKVVTTLGILVLTAAWVYSIATDEAFNYQRTAATTPGTTLPAAPAEGEESVKEEVLVVGPVAQAGSGEKSAPVVPSEIAAGGKAASPTTPGNQIAANETITGTANGTITAPAGPPSIDPEPVELPQLAMDGVPGSPNPMPTPPVITPPTSAPPAEEMAESAPAPQNSVTQPPTTESPMPPTSATQTPEMQNPATQAAGTQPPASGGGADPTLTIPNSPICLTPGIQVTALEAAVIRSAEFQPQARLTAPMQEIPAGESFYIAPYSQADLSLGGEQIRLHARHNTTFKILGADQESCLGFEMMQGRIVLQFTPPFQSQPLRLRLQVYHKTWLVELTNQPTRIAIEVLPQFPTHYEQLPVAGPVISRMWVLDASVKLQTAPDKWVEVMGSRQLLPQISDPAAPQPNDAGEPVEIAPLVVKELNPTASLPDWINKVPLNLTTSQRREQRDFLKSIENSTNLWLDLQGGANDPNPRIAELAAQCLALGQRHEALVAVLAHSPHEESRTAAISGLRSWLLCSPDNRRLLQESLRKTFNDQTALVVYNLLWGYDQQDARNPTMSRQIVDWLRHEHVAVRELAIYWISQLTGQKQGYRPLAPVNTREQTVVNWERHLARVGALVDPKN